MAPDQEPTDRDAAVRTMLVERVTRPKEAPAMRLAPGRARSGLVTAVVLAVVVALSVIAIRFGTAGSAPAGGGVSASATPLPTASAGPTPLPTADVPVGKVLGRFTSEDGPVQTHTIHPDGLAVSSVIACSGGPKSTYWVTIANQGSSGGPTGCGGVDGWGDSAGSVGPVTVHIRTTGDLVWTLTFVGVPPTATGR